MTASKPAVVAYYCPNNPDAADAFSWKNTRCDSRSCDCTRQPLIRLADHERLQAEAERLQADHEATRAADKARIAELEKALMEAKQHITSGPYGAHPALETIARIDAALAQQGKEGET